MGVVDCRQIQTSLKHNKFRICLLVESSPITSVNRQTVRFRRLLDFLVEQTDDDVALVTSEAVVSSPPTLWRGRVPIHYTQGFIVPFFPSLTVSFDWTVTALRVILEHMPQVIHVSSPGLLLPLACLASRIFQIPLVASYHAHLPVYARTKLPPIINFIVECIVWAILFMLHSCADLTVVMSPQRRGDLEEHCIPRCVVWPKGVDTQQFHPRHWSQEMRHRMTDGAVDCFLMLYVGRPSADRRIRDLKQILLAMPDSACLCMVGTGPRDAELRRYFEGTRTVFLRQLLGLEMCQAYASADVLVMPSYSHVTGYVVLESMASGVPCVVANIGGVATVIRDGNTGFLVPSGDTAGFARRLQQLQSYPILRQTMAKLCRSELEKWSWDQSMKTLRYKLYAQARTNFRNRYEQRFWRWVTDKERQIALGNNEVMALKNDKHKAQ